ncbi:Arylsulfatase [Pirellulimonas nuda]|uniref:Arylsulfatase n=1 Tax=Pirellulimonas nuda TaxID=2528009 RepID=A0A518DBL2_9BACT|nr:arylsulfatase [Pirellulimonas nuda]QDU88862.1 Arylsulfatase [Pirellulimonas nuda]
MNRIITLIAISLLSAYESKADDAVSQPNIVYFLIDDMGYADCGFNGSTDIRTPHIDRLANEGAVLKSFYVQPLCSPTRAALLSGRYPTHTGVYHVVTPGAEWGLPLDERTLPQALSEAGYATSICGKWHLGEFRAEYRPSQRGFGHQYGHMMGNLDYFTHLRDGKLDWYRNDEPLEEEGYTTSLIADEAGRVIRSHPSGKPLFLYVPFNGVHSPYQTPASYCEPYQELPKPRKTLAGMMAAVDESIGKIAAALEERGMRENTLIIFSSDNGGSNPGKVSMNTPLRAGKGSVYEGGVRVPAFATWPGKIAAGSTIDEPMHVVDWYPTLLKLAGAPASQQHAPDGLDIWPVLTEGAPSPHDAILLQGTTPPVKALRMGDWKLIANDSSPPELYNLEADIAEKRNLADARPDLVRSMRERLNAMTKDALPLGGPLPSAR